MGEEGGGRLDRKEAKPAKKFLRDKNSFRHVYTLILSLHTLCLCARAHICVCRCVYEAKKQAVFLPPISFLWLAELYGAFFGRGGGDGGCTNDRKKI